MKTKALYLISSVAVMALAACSSDVNEIPVGNDCPEFSATIGLSRAIDQSWESGDAIGVTGALRTNVCYHTPEGDGNFTVKTAGEEIYFQDANVVTFTAYYPWNNLAESVVTIAADTKEQNKQKSFDFLWATATGKKDAPNVAFNFSHKMAKVVFTVKPGEGMDFNEFGNTILSLDKFKHTGSFNVTDGTATASGNAETWVFTEFAKSDETEKTLTFSFIVFPQVLDNPLDFLAEIKLSAGNPPLNLKAAIDFTAANSEKDGNNARNEWVAGRQYNLNITLNKTEIKLGECVINPWNVVAGDDISVD